MQPLFSPAPRFWRGRPQSLPCLICSASLSASRFAPLHLMYYNSSFAFCPPGAGFSHLQRCSKDPVGPSSGARNTHTRSILPAALLSSFMYAPSCTLPLSPRVCAVRTTQHCQRPRQQVWRAGFCGLYRHHPAIPSLGFLPPVVGALAPLPASEAFCLCLATRRVFLASAQSGTSPRLCPLSAGCFMQFIQRPCMFRPRAGARAPQRFCVVYSTVLEVFSHLYVARSAPPLPFGREHLCIISQRPFARLVLVELLMQLGFVR